MKHRYTTIYGMFILLSAFSGALAQGSFSLAPVVMRTALDGDGVGAFDGVFDVFVGLPSVNPALGPDYEQRAILEFDLSQLGPIGPSYVILFRVQDFSSTPELQVHGYFGNGAEDLADMQVSNLIATIGPITSNGMMTLDVTAFVQSSITGGHRYAGFMFRDVTANSDVLFNFTDDIPRLVPEPSSVALLTVGIMVFFLVRHTRSNKVMAANPVSLPSESFE